MVVVVVALVAMEGVQAQENGRKHFPLLKNGRKFLNFFGLFFIDLRKCYPLAKIFTKHFPGMLSSKTNELLEKERTMKCYQTFHDNSEY